MQIKSTSITSQCLNVFKDYVLKNYSSFNRIELGSMVLDAPNFKEDWNQPQNFCSRPINDVFTYEFEVMLQNETNGIVKLSNFYEEGDYIGWHTNSAVQGYNLILTYSDSTESFFETRDGKTYDLLGWSYKVNEFTDKPLWHRAVSKGNRITISMLFETEQDFNEGLARIKEL